VFKEANRSQPENDNLAPHQKNRSFPVLEAVILPDSDIHNARVEPIQVRSVPPWLAVINLRPASLKASIKTCPIFRLSSMNKIFY
jgi:hypothetical protein